MKKCWAPIDEAPLGVKVKRKKIPTVLGHVATEKDEDCILLSVQSPGPYDGAYIMLLVFPLRMEPKPDRSCQSRRCSQEGVVSLRQEVLAFVFIHEGER